MSAMMTAPLVKSRGRRFSAASLKSLPGQLMAPLPPVILKPLLQRCVRKIAAKRPEIFTRLGPCAHKTYVVDAVNLPFVFVLSPRPEQPVLLACRRQQIPKHDARISGTFLTLLEMIDGHLDGDALFFTRDLRIEGDVQAVVVLRNALDDLEGSIAEDLISPFGQFASLTLAILRKLRRPSFE